MSDDTIDSSLFRAKWACYVLAFFGMCISALFALILISEVVYRTGTAQSPYSIVMALCGGAYFLATTRQAILASKHAKTEASIPQLIRPFSDCVIAFFLGLSVLVLLVILLFVFG